MTDYYEQLYNTLSFQIKMFIMLFSFSLSFAHIFDILTLKMNLGLIWNTVLTKIPHKIHLAYEFVLFCLVLWVFAASTGGTGVADCPAEGTGRRSVWWEDEGLYLEHTQVWKGKEAPHPQTTLVIIMTSFSTLTQFQNNTSGDVRGPVVSTRSYC